MEVKGADHHLAKRVVQEVVGYQKVMMVVMQEMAGIHEMVRMVEKVEMAG